MKFRTKQAKRTITVIGDEGDFRHFCFDDNPDVMTQWRIDSWDYMFESIEA